MVVPLRTLELTSEVEKHTTTISPWELTATYSRVWRINQDENVAAG